MLYKCLHHTLFRRGHYSWTDQGMASYALHQALNLQLVSVFQPQENLDSFGICFLLVKMSLLCLFHPFAQPETSTDSWSWGHGKVFTVCFSACLKFLVATSIAKKNITSHFSMIAPRLLFFSFWSFFSSEQFGLWLSKIMQLETQHLIIFLCHIFNMEWKKGEKLPFKWFYFSKYNNSIN